MRRRDIFRGLLAGLFGWLGLGRFVTAAVPTNYFKNGPLFPEGLWGFVSGVNKALLYEADAGGFHYFFTGYKMRQNSTELLGQVCAWPHTREEGRYYEVCTSSVGRLYVDELVLGAEGLVKARGLRDRALTALLKVMRERGESV